MSHFRVHTAQDGWNTSRTGRQSSLFLKGKVYDNQSAIDVHKLSQALAECTTADQLRSRLSKLNGFYAWVEKSALQVRAAVDHVRSRPLFYGEYAGQFYISDSAEWLRQQVRDCDMDRIAREEFQITGYVTGSDTLFPKVKQLQAGEFLVARKTDVGIVVEKQRYYRFLHNEPSHRNYSELRHELDCATSQAIRRLMDYANGRQIVIPLSGGYDSRLIATVLKRLGYQNIVTFTYGKPGNKESAYSQRVAHALGLKWHIVEYSEELWRSARQTNEHWDYQKWASGWSSIAHVQDWPAVKKLKQEAIIETDAVFVPGHSGDFVAGSHIPSMAFERTAFKLEDVERAIFSGHYNLRPVELFSTTSREWLARIRNRTERTRCAEAWEFADGYEKWDWQERQSKFVCNSVRAYEFYGFDWWMPLWDVEFIKFWERVPLALRESRSWYVSYVKSQFSAMSISDQNIDNAADLTGLNKHLYQSGIVSAIKRIRILSSLIKMLRKAKRKKSSLGWEALYHKEHVRTFNKWHLSWDGLEAYETIINIDTFIKQPESLSV
jgi:asparagine synthase (glutamine-hydrolysing)